MSIHEKSSLTSSSGRLSVKNVVAASGPAQLHEISQQDDDVGSPKSSTKQMERRLGGEESSVDIGNKSFCFGPIQDAGLQKVILPEIVLLKK